VQETERHVRNRVERIVHACSGFGLRDAKTLAQFAAARGEGWVVLIGSPFDRRALAQVVGEHEWPGDHCSDNDGEAEADAQQAPCLTRGADWLDGSYGRKTDRRVRGCGRHCAAGRARRCCNTSASRRSAGQGRACWAAALLARAHHAATGDNAVVDRDADHRFVGAAEAAVDESERFALRDAEFACLPVCENAVGKAAEQVDERAVASAGQL